jgi:hypothetical protein
MSQSRSWRVASHELAEFVQEAGPRVVLVGAVACLMLGVPMALRFLVSFTW